MTASRPRSAAARSAHAPWPRPAGPWPRSSAAGRPPVERSTIDPARSPVTPLACIARTSEASGAPRSERSARHVEQRLRPRRGLVVAEESPPPHAASRRAAVISPYQASLPLHYTATRPSSSPPVATPRTSRTAGDSRCASPIGSYGSRARSTSMATRRRPTGRHGWGPPWRLPLDPYRSSLAVAASCSFVDEVPRHRTPVARTADAGRPAPAGVAGRAWCPPSRR